MTVFSLAAYGVSVLFAAPVLGFFAPQDSHVFELVLANFGYFALSLLLLCPNMFAAYLFTAMVDGKRAARQAIDKPFENEGALLHTHQGFGWSIEAPEVKTEIEPEAKSEA